MRPTITRKRLAFALSVAGAFATVTASLAAATATVVGGLDGPRGIALGSDGRLLVAETPSGDLTEIHSKGKGLVSTSTVATLPTAPGGEWGPVDVASTRSVFVPQNW